MRRRVASVAAVAALVVLAALVLVLGRRAPHALSAQADSTSLAHPPRPAGLAPVVSAAPGAPPGVLSARSRSGTAFFAPEGVTVALSGPPVSGDEERRYAWALRWSVEGAPPVTPEGVDRVPGVDNFYRGNDPSKWRIGVPRHGGALYRQLRPGLDVKVTPVEDGLQLAVSASAAALRDTWFRWEGQASAAPRSDGALALATPYGTVTQTLHGAVRVAQTRQEPGGFAYRLEAVQPLGFTSGTFTVGVAWAGYVPANVGPTVNALNELHLDRDGNIVIVGETNANEFPATVGRVTPMGQDAYVATIRPDGGVKWGTLIGGNNTENGEDVAFDSSGNLYLVGKTSSSQITFPQPNAYDGTYNGAGDVFVTRLDADGGLQWSTFLGGSGTEWGLVIGVSPAGTVWVAGGTGSNDFPLAGAFQSTNPNTNCGTFGTCDGFIAAFDPDGGSSSLLFSSFIGPTVGDGGTVEIYDIAFDPAGNVWVAGNSGNSGITFPGYTLAPPVQSGYDGGARDGIILRLNPNGATGPEPTYFSYFGGSGTEDIGSLAVDSSTGAIYLAGRTSSPNFPRVAGLNNQPAGGNDGFITKLAPGGATIAWSSLLGGAGADEVRNFVIGPDGALALVGNTTSPAITGFNGVLNGTVRDAFVARVSANGLSLDWGTYLGGTDLEDGRGIAVDARGNVYAGGDTFSDDFPSTLGPPFVRTGSSVDGFIVKYDTTTPDGGVVADGPAPGDLTFQASTTSLTANWYGFFDQDAPIANYQYAMGLAPFGTQVTGGFVDAGLQTEVNRLSSLGNGVTYYTTVRAINAAGLSVDRSSNGVTVDATPPDAGAVRDGPPTGPDRQFQRPGVPIEANWDAWTDPESGITEYEWAIGTASGATNVKPFSSVGLARSAGAMVATTPGAQYYVLVKALNGARGFSARSSDGVTIDGTPPDPGVVNDGPTDGVDIDVQPRTALLAANWTGFGDPQSGIDRYEWAIGTTFGGTDTLPFTLVGTATIAEAPGVTTVVGTTYYVTVRAYNGAGDFNPAISTGVTVLAADGDPCSVPTDCASGLCPSDTCLPSGTEVDLVFSRKADGGTHFGAREEISAEVTSLVSADLQGLQLVMTAADLALDVPDSGTPAGGCGDGLTVPVPRLFTGDSVTVPVVAYVCRGSGPDPARLVGHVASPSGARLTADAVLDLPVEGGNVPLGCNCTAAGVPGVLIGLAALLRVRGRRRR